MPALIVRDGPAAGERLEVESETVLGRETHEFLQHDGEVSRRHAALRPSGGALEVEDLGSSNGTFVNDQPIDGRTPLGPGDSLRLGQTTLEVEATAATRGTIVRDVPQAAPAGPEETAPLAPPAGPGPAPAGSPPLSGPPPAGPPAGPPGYAPAGPPGLTLAKRPGIVTAAGTVLIVVGALSAAYGIWRIVDLLKFRGEVAEIAAFLGIDSALEMQALILVILDVLAVIGSILAVIGGVRFLARSPAGAALGIVGVALVLVGWAAYAGYGLMSDITFGWLDWVFIVVLFLGAALGLALALVGRRRLVSLPPPWAQ